MLIPNFKVLDLGGFRRTKNWSEASLPHPCGGGGLERLDFLRNAVRVFFRSERGGFPQCLNRISQARRKGALNLVKIDFKSTAS